MEIKEPTITKEDILILNDADFGPRNVAIVSGAASGIGRATMVACAANGLVAVGLDVNEAGGQGTVDIAKGLGHDNCHFIKCNLTDEADMTAAVEAAAKLGTIKYLANIAGLQHIDPIQNFPMAKFDLMMSVMVRAAFYLSQLCIPHMQQSADGKGAIGNMGSVHAHICTMNKPVYNLAKFANRALAQSISAEGAGKIRGFSVSTGFISTQLALNQIPAQAAQRGISHEEVVRDVMLGKSRVKEMMSPIEVANLFTFGFSRFAKYLVGGDLLFDGGMVLTY